MKSISDVVSGSGLAVYAEIALVIFFLVFVALIVRLLMSSKRSFADQTRLPFEDGSGNAANPPSTHDVRGAKHVER